MEGRGGHFYVFTLLHVSEHSEHFCFWLFLWCEKINYFTDGGYLPPFAENSAKIINLIFEPFPNFITHFFVAVVWYLVFSF